MEHSGFFGEGGGVFADAVHPLLYIHICYRILTSLLKLVLHFSFHVYFVSSGFPFSLPVSNNCSMWLCLVFRVLPSAHCQVVTVRVCRSPHVVCQAVHTPQGNNQSRQGIFILYFSVFIYCLLRLLLLLQCF